VFTRKHHRHHHGSHQIKRETTSKQRFLLIVLRLRIKIILVSRDDSERKEREKKA